MKRTIYTPGSVQVRETADGTPSRTITGYAIVFNQQSEPFYDDDIEQIREVIAPESVTLDLLNRSDILMTLFHDNKEILGRSKNGEGTLKYGIDDNGVKFEFEAPNTIDGERALELVKRGDIQGCSFAFTADYLDRNVVSKESVKRDNKLYTTYTVRHMDGIFDFTLTPRPAYGQTTVEARDIVKSIREKRQQEEEKKREHDKLVEKQVAEMRSQIIKKKNIY
ncbi:MAG: HK97 family phage prohead protease [Prevotella sp.]|jgi:HK97 family phage prohead protease|nr:HK97 family phage prohead protease [Prevotella sp.]